uniref:Transcription factor TGA4 n=1 Tax=Aegilops tauschii subsp. strangulata TaxID=200361 RepID=A0A453DA90_AEGTS
MTSAAAAQYAPAPLRMAMYERAPPQQHQQQQQPQLQPALGMWSSEPYKVDSGGQATSGSSIMEPDAKFDHAGVDEDPQMDELETAGDADQGASKPKEKVMRRLAQNREAARKSRLRKKVYIQQLESSRIKLAQLEQELQRTRQQQGVYGGSNPGTSLQRHHGGGSAGHFGFAAAGQMMDPGVAAFEIDYGRWVDEQKRHTEELRNALQPGQATSELELEVMVQTGLANYDNLFQIKGAAAQADVFCVMSGLWRSPAERFFLWIGGFRPSEVWQILSPQLEPMTDPQSVAVYALQLTSAQAEDALSQGMQKLQQTLAESLTDPFAAPDAYMVGAVEKLKGIVVVGVAGGPSPAGDAAEHAQDPDDAAGGQGPARAGGLLPAPSRAQHALGGPPARVRHKLNCARSRSNGGSRERSMMAQKKLVRTYVVIHP